MSDAAIKIQAARVGLVLDQPFFGVLALRLRVVEDKTCKTVWVDGRTLGYNPEFIEKWTHDEVVTLLAHEVMHCAAGHPWRRDAREMKRWNEACDRAINPILRGSGFKLPDGACVELDPTHAGKSAEWIHDRLPPPQDDPQGGAGDGTGDGPGSGTASLGEVRDAPQDGAEDGATEQDWSAAVQQAAKAAEAAGKLPGALERLVEDAATSRVDWCSVLRRFVQERSTADYAWQRPSARYLARGLYLPSLYSEELGAIVVAIDTSGSIDDVLLRQFSAEVQAVVSETQPRQVHVVYCDARVQRHDVIERGDPVELTHVGGGGTKFEPVFDLVEQLEEPPACVVYLTDLRGSFPPVEPSIPTLWVTPTNEDAPFGEVVRIA